MGEKNNEEFVYICIEDEFSPRKKQNEKNSRKFYILLVDFCQ